MTSIPLSRVEAAGGKVIMPKTDIAENGFTTQLLDTEGNKVALHSWKNKALEQKIVNRTPIHYLCFIPI